MGLRAVGMLQQHTPQQQQSGSRWEGCLCQQNLSMSTAASIAAQKRWLHVTHVARLWAWASQTATLLKLPCHSQLRMWVCNLVQGCTACGAEGDRDAAAANADGGDEATAGSGDWLCKRCHWMPCAGRRPGFGQPSQAPEAPCPCLSISPGSQCPCIWVSHRCQLRP